MDSSKQIKLARESQGLSMAEAARRFGGTRQQWFQWESGTHAPSITTLERIAAALDMSVVELLTVGDTENAEVA